MDLNNRQLLEVAFDALAGDDELPHGMESRILAAAAERPKPAMHAGWATPTLSAHAAYVQTAAELADLLDHLSSDDWDQPTCVADCSVVDLVAHLVGVERYVLGQLGRGRALQAPRREDHLTVSREAASDLGGASPVAVRRTWWLEVLDVVAACAQLGPDRLVEYHHLAGTINGLLVVRTFELWTHDDDIRRAIGHPANSLDDARLSLMVGKLMRVLPFGLALSGCAQAGRTARIILTGPGGGSFDVALSPGDEPAGPDIEIRAAAIDLCRLAANRLSRDDLDARIEGEASLAECVLVGATAFAAD